MKPGVTLRWAVVELLNKRICSCIEYCTSILSFGLLTGSISSFMDVCVEPSRQSDCPCMFAGGIVRPTPANQFSTGTRGMKSGA